MAKKKKLQSGFELNGIAPNILLKHVENTAPFLFAGELNTDGDKKEYLEKLRFYKKNLKALAHIDLAEYFHICMAAHWSTAGTFVPTDVDNQIREGLWKHKNIKKHIEKMAKITIDSWTWDYEQVTNRKSYNRLNDEVMSTHEGTWLSVAIGAYCALIQNDLGELATQVAEVILKEIKKEETLLMQLKKDQDHINFLRAAPLMAHNFGDLDRVIVQWKMEDEGFCKSIFKLGHRANPNYNPILVYTGKVNKEFSSKENHRHMAMRQPKCLRKSKDFLIPVGPFMDKWGHDLGSSLKLSPVEKAEVIIALFEGFKREEEAFGYIRGYHSLIKAVTPSELNEIEANIPFDLIHEIKKSEFKSLSGQSEEGFNKDYILRLNSFKCPETGILFNE